MSYRSFNGFPNDLSILHVPQDTLQCWALQIRCLRKPLGKSAKNILLDMEDPHFSMDLYGTYRDYKPQKLSGMHSQVWLYCKKMWEMANHQTYLSRVYFSGYENGYNRVSVGI